MPSRWEVELPGVDPAVVKLEHLHAVVSGWLDEGDVEHRRQAKPYTVSPLKVTATGAAVEIGLLDAIDERLLAAASVGCRVRLGSVWTRLDQPPRRIAETSWAALAEPRPSANAWCLRFVTPTTFRRRNAFTPSPSLRAILGSLRGSWRQWAPAGVPPLVLDLATEPVWLTDIEVASQVVRVNELTVSGFVGRIRFVCDHSGPIAEAVDSLVRLAPYAGVGAYTTRGFGQTRHDPTRSHPVARGAPALLSTRS